MKLKQQIIFAGNIIYDFFMGHELNPRFGSFDFKFFCEMRPGLIGWTMINMIFLVKDYQQDGQVDPSLALVAFFQALYVADALWFEVRPRIKNMVLKIQSTLVISALPNSSYPLHQTDFSVLIFFRCIFIVFLLCIPHTHFFFTSGYLFCPKRYSSSVFNHA